VIVNCAPALTGSGSPFAVAKARRAQPGASRWRMALKLGRARYKPLGRKLVWVDHQAGSAQFRAQRPSRHLGMVRN